MKILLTSDWYIPAVNGVVTSVCNLQRELTRRGHEVRLLTLAPGVETRQQGGVTWLGSLDAGWIYPGARLRAGTGGQAIRELIAWGPDVVHSQCEFSTFGPACRIARACGAPLLHTYHTVYEDYTHYFFPFKGPGRALVRSLTRLVAGRTDGLIAPTPKVEALLLGYGVRCPVEVVPTGIDLERFARPADPGRTAALRARLGIPAGDRVLVFVGRLAREKNIEELLACRAALGSGVTLLVVGGGPEEERLRAMAGPGVIFAGMADPAEVPDYYRLGDVFVSASTSETQGLTYLEALASGLPALCRADPCLEGVVTPGENGMLYQTPEELLRAARLLLADETLRNRMAQAAARSARKFTTRAFGQRMEALYRTHVLAHRSAAGCHRRLLWQEI